MPHSTRRHFLKSAATFTAGATLSSVSAFGDLSTGTAFSGGQRDRYPLPLVDLAGRPSMQTVIDREKGQYLGHPTSVLLEDGETIYCAYPKAHGAGPLVLKRSDDGGQTWSDRLPVPDNWATSHEVPTMYRVADRAGNKRLLLFFRGAPHPNGRL